MRVGLVLSVLLSVVATLPAYVQAAPRVGPGNAWIGKGFRRGQSKADGKSEPPSAQSEDELRAAALARKRGQDMERMMTDEKKREVGGEMSATHAIALRLLSLKLNNLRWFELSKVDKVLGIVMAAQNAASWGFGTNRARLILVLKPLVAEPLIAQALIVLKKRKVARGPVSVHGTRNHISWLPGVPPKSTDDPFPSQPPENRLQSCGWFGCGATPSAAGSRRSAIVVASEATLQDAALQDASARQRMQALPREDSSVEGSVVGEGEQARGDRALLLKHIRERTNAKLLKKYQAASVGGRYVRGYPFTYWPQW